MDSKKAGEWLAIVMVVCVAVVILTGTVWVVDAMVDGMKAGC